MQEIRCQLQNDGEKFWREKTKKNNKEKRTPTEQPDFVTIFKKKNKNIKSPKRNKNKKK